MTKTTTTCDGCFQEIGSAPYIPYTLIEGALENTVKPSSARTLHFCSRSCLAEYLKPKTETTP